MADEQPQAFADVARADGFVFGCEEGLEDVLADIKGDAGAVVFDGQANPRSEVGGRKSEVSGACDEVTVFRASERPTFSFTEDTGAWCAAFTERQRAALASVKPATDGTRVHDNRSVRTSARI